MSIIKTIKNIFPGMGSPTAYNTNINASCAAGNTIISIPIGTAQNGPISVGLVRVKSELIGANAQLRVLAIKGDDGASNTVEFYSGDAVSAGINQNIDQYYEFATDLAMVNVNLTINVINGTSNISVEVAGGP